MHTYIHICISLILLLLFALGGLVGDGTHHRVRSLRLGQPDLALLLRLREYNHKRKHINTRLTPCISHRCIPISIDFSKGAYTKGTRAHTHRELIREWPWEPKGSSREYI